ncbi:hypothetical protein L6452_35428 [Arctium lappa]|uniref:Uncharacterized protein n=1 Tax=Arctium lappa TaxID=4217 RepID=A0ACB8Y6E5_ARCLA|nr:hypothetical protein L6452_35428 [Arctium lappa]
MRCRKVESDPTFYNLQSHTLFPSPPMHVQFFIISCCLSLKNTLHSARSLPLSHVPQHMISTLIHSS